MPEGSLSVCFPPLVFALPFVFGARLSFFFRACEPPPVDGGSGVDLGGVSAGYAGWPVSGGEWGLGTGSALGVSGGGVGSGL